MLQHVLRSLLKRSYSSDEIIKMERYATGAKGINLAFNYV